MTLDADLPDALSRATVPAVRSTKGTKTHPEFYLDVVVKSGLDVKIADAIVAGDLERSMDGASTLSLTLHDPHRELLRHPDLAKAIDMFFADNWWRLVKITKSGNDLTLTFESREVAYLRRHTGARKMSRNTGTRAQFIRQLVREVGQRRPAQSKNPKTYDYVAQKPIPFVCPELTRTQPVDDGADTKAPAKRTKDGRERDRQPGIPDRADLTVKGARADANQRRVGERVLDVADELGAGPKATLALMEAVIIESQIRDLTYGDADSIGVLQLRTGLHGYATASSVEKSVHAFLTRGFTGQGGAMALARQHSTWSAAQVAQAVQGSAPAAYATVHDEAWEWVEAYGGASGTDTGGSAGGDSSRGKKKYEFRRGEPGKPEDSWTAIQRLASEVGWHAFMDRGRLYYVSDNYLMRQKARYIVDEDDDGIQGIDFDIDQGKVSSEITVSARADLFQVPVGCVMAIRKCGIANGRYIVTRVRQPIYDNACEITLRAPTPKLDEPAAETKSASTTSGGGTDAEASGTLRDRIVAVAEASRSSYNKNPASWFYSQPGSLYYGDPTKPPPRGTRSDCSQWVAAVYKKAGAPAPGPSYSVSIYTGNMKVRGRAVPFSQAQPGDIIVGPSHVELYVGPGAKTIGHGSAPVDYGTWGLVRGGVCWRYSFLDDD